MSHIARSIKYLSLPFNRRSNCPAVRITKGMRSFTSQRRTVVSFGSQLVNFQFGLHCAEKVRWISAAPRRRWTQANWFASGASRVSLSS